MPERLVNSLIERNAQFTLKANNFTSSIADGPAIGYKPKGATPANPYGEDLGLLVSNALTEARKIGMTPPSREEVIRKILGNQNQITNDQPFADVAQENSRFIFDKDPITDASGFGLRSTDIQDLPKKQKNQPSEASGQGQTTIETIPADNEMKDFKLPDIKNNDVDNNQQIQPKGLRKLGGKMTH